MGKKKQEGKFLQSLKTKIMQIFQKKQLSPWQKTNKQKQKSSTKETTIFWQNVLFNYNCISNPKLQHQSKKYRHARTIYYTKLLLKRITFLQWELNISAREWPPPPAQKEVEENCKTTLYIEIVLKKQLQISN